MRGDPRSQRRLPDLTRLRGENNAEDGEEAISKYQKGMKEGCRFDAVIMDLTVPGKMGGKEAIEWLKNESRGQKDSTNPDILMIRSWRTT